MTRLHSCVLLSLALFALRVLANARIPLFRSTRSPTLPGRPFQFLVLKSAAT